MLLPVWQDVVHKVWQDLRSIKWRAFLDCHPTAPDLFQCTSSLLDWSATRGYPVILWYLSLGVRTLSLTVTFRFILNNVFAQSPFPCVEKQFRLGFSERVSDPLIAQRGCSAEPSSCSAKTPFSFAHSYKSGEAKSEEYDVWSIGRIRNRVKHLIDSRLGGRSRYLYGT
jgi:hypothetical protein